MADCDFGKSNLDQCESPSGNFRKSSSLKERLGKRRRDSSSSSSLVDSGKEEVMKAINRKEKRWRLKAKDSRVGGRRRA